MQSVSPEKNNRIKKNNSIVWLTAALLAILVIATVSVAGSCIYSYAHKNDCQISLYDGQIKKASGSMKNTVSQKSKSTDPVLKSQAVQYSGNQVRKVSRENAFEVSDATKVWKTETAVELFKTEYKNADSRVTVKSADGNKIIAPGTEGKYTFSLKNTEDNPADYKIWVEAKASTSMTDIPMQIKMTGNKDWLLGDKNTWKRAEELNQVTTSETLDAGDSAEYTIYWQWPYECGNDTADTTLGNITADQNTSYTVTIYTMAAAETGTDEPNNRNTANHFWKLPKTGDHTHILLWGIILASSAGVILCLFILKKRKNDKENEHNRTE